jgi:guanyl-specific ribonuclease Sa
MTLAVTDVRSNSNDQIAHAAKVIGRSKTRRAIFEELHRSKRRIKTVSQLEAATGLTRQRVLDDARKLAHEQIVKATKRDGEIAYERDGFFYGNRNKILGLVKNPKKLKAFPTKYSPKAATIRIVHAVPKRLVQTKIVTMDMIDSFAKTRRKKSTASSLAIRENTFKNGVKRIIGETGRFKDWGGETSDLYTTRLRVGGSRKAAAFGFKGKGLTGVLTPARMGKNGDQIPRLFQEDADVFIVQYGGQIAGSVMQQMAVYAQHKSLATGRTIFYGTMNGQDSALLVAAYPRAFRAKA